MSKANSLSALLPVHTAVVEALAHDYAGEQFAPRSGATAADIHSLQGRSDLVAIAQNDPTLALKLKWLIDACGEADWENARHALDHVAFSIRSHQLESCAGESGVVR